MSSPPRFPLLSFATVGHPIANLRALVAVSQQVGLPAIDLEAAGRTRRKAPGAVAETVRSAGLRVNALWLVLPTASVWAQPRDESLVEWAAELARTAQVSAVVA